MLPDYAGSARLGNWIETNIDMQKIGRPLAFANAYLCVGSTRIVRASVVFPVVERP